MKSITTTALKIILSFTFLFTLQKSSSATLYSINVPLSGAQENPPVAGGSGTFSGTYNSTTKVISYTINFSVTGTTTAGHFHGPAAVGSNAGVQIGYTAIPLGVSSGFFSESKTLTATQETQLLSGLWYANIHSSTFGGGAIRGQLYPLELSTMSLTYLIEGLYNSGSNTMVGDTVTVNLRSAVSPYSVVSSSKAFLNSSGSANINFTNAVNGTNYYIQILHRNALETYNGVLFSFTSNAGSYNFTTSSSQALGNNLILKGSKYCVYSGDIDHNGFIDLSDIISVLNDGNNFVTGYAATDIDGDNIISLADLLIVYNNTNLFVSAVVPAP
jgi:hypothetical protein